MQLNQPYDPRYNAKVYVPKLTEEQRLARATPLEDLLSLRTRLAAAAAQGEAPAPVDVVTEAPAPEDAPETRHVSDVRGAPVPQQVPVTQDMPVLCERPAPPEVPLSRDVVAHGNGSPSHYIPTALEILCAEFPEIFASQARQPHKEAHADDESLVSAGRFSLPPRLRRGNPLVPKLCLGMQSPELRSATPPNQSSPQIPRSALPDQCPLVPRLRTCHYP